MVKCMNKKAVIICSIVIILLVLWFSGIIPKQIGKIYGTSYMKNNFPEMQLEFDGIEWNKYYGDYIISFKDKNNQTYSCVIGPKYFPISMGQGIFGIEEKYREDYGTENDNTMATTKAVVVKVNENGLIVADTENMSLLYSVGIKKFKDIELKKGQEIIIYHSGDIMESYPAQFGNVSKIVCIQNSIATKPNIN